MYTRLHAVNGIVGKGVKFERIRRVTGYLGGTLDRFNDAKRAEVRDRVKRMLKKIAPSLGAICCRTNLTKIYKPSIYADFLG